MAYTKTILNKKQTIYILLIFCFSIGSCTKKNISSFAQEAASKSNASPVLDSDCISIDLPNMNVFYVGVDNPITITTPNVDPKMLKVTISEKGGGSIRCVRDNEYSVRVTRPIGTEGRCFIKVAGEGFNKTIPFQIKRIPNPVAKLYDSQGGSIGTGQFKAQKGMSAVLERFEYDVNCEIMGFIVTHIPKGQDYSDSVNRGAEFTEKSRRLIDKAKPGDFYFFDKIKARCPGDVAGRAINSMVFRIK